MYELMACFQSAKPRKLNSERMKIWLRTSMMGPQRAILRPLIPTTRLKVSQASNLMNLQTVSTEIIYFVHLLIVRHSSAACSSSLLFITQ